MTTLEELLENKPFVKPNDAVIAMLQAGDDKGKLKSIQYILGTGVDNSIEVPENHYLYKLFDAEYEEERRAVYFGHVVCSTIKEQLELVTAIMECNEV